MRAFGKLALRDAGIAAAALGLWWAAARFSAGGGPLADFTGFVAGLALGAVAYIAHEWGHLLGAFASRSRVYASKSLKSPSVFKYSKQNSLAQFLVMSVSGFAATGAAIWAVYTQLPPELLATRVARGAVMFLTFLGVVLELPLVAIAIKNGATPAVAGVEVPREAARPAA